MRVILLQDMRGTGKKGEVRNVSEGFFRNFLGPHHFATIATAETLKKNEQQTIRHKKQEEKEQKNTQHMFARLDGAEIKLDEPASSDGTLFRGIKAQIIAQQLARSTGLSIDPKYIKLDHPLKRIGTYPVEIESGKELRATITCIIQPRAK